jgi:pyruvate formate lyase activating enzyme
VYNHRYENTYCPACGATLIERQGFSSTIKKLDGQQCMNCGEKIEIVRHVSKTSP